MHKKTPIGLQLVYHAPMLVAFANPAMAQANDEDEAEITIRLMESAEAELPANARRYIDRIEELCGTRVSVIGVGPGRDENVVRHPLL